MNALFSLIAPLCLHRRHMFVDGSGSCTRRSRHICMFLSRPRRGTSCLLLLLTPAAPTLKLNCSCSTTTQVVLAPHTIMCARHSVMCAQCDCLCPTPTLPTVPAHCSNTLYIFSEWVPGGSLRDLLDDFGPLRESVARDYARQVRNYTSRGVYIFIHTSSTLSESV